MYIISNAACLGLTDTAKENAQVQSNLFSLKRKAAKMLKSGLSSSGLSPLCNCDTVKAARSIWAPGEPHDAGW